MESKEAVVERLHFTLHATRAGHDILEMRYKKMPTGEEYVEIFWKTGGVRRVDVTADSGLAMICDVMEAIR